MAAHQRPRRRGPEDLRCALSACWSGDGQRAGLHGRAFRGDTAHRGERVWFALYCGEPTAPAGGLVKQKWLDDWRLLPAPSRPVFTVVAVDPSDSGSGDSCGLIATSLTGQGVVALIAGKSRPMTSDEWARESVQLAIDVGASEIAVEGFAARETYTRVVKEAITRAEENGTLNRPIKVSAWPPKGRPRVGDAVARSAALLQALEVGTCRLVGYFPEFETKAVAWQGCPRRGQHRPDRWCRHCHAGIGEQASGTPGVLRPLGVPSG